MKNLKNIKHSGEKNNLDGGCTTLVTYRTSGICGGELIEVTDQ